MAVETQQLEQAMKHSEEAQNELLLKKIALQQNVSRCTEQLKQVVAQRKRFAEMKDISQFAPIAVFYVLKYLELHDFVAAIGSCRAWYFSLNKPAYWRVLQRDAI